MSAKFGFIFLGSMFILEAIWALSGGKIYFKYQGWQTISEKSIFGFFIVGLIFIFFGLKYKPKHSDFTRCKKCKKIYNFSDTKDMICPKCGGDLQDYAEFEKEQENKKQDEFKEAEKFQDEWIKQIKKKRKKK